MMPWLIEVIWNDWRTPTRPAPTVAATPALTIRASWANPPRGCAR